jgi:hypothetical protein
MSIEHQDPDPDLTTLMNTNRILRKPVLKVVLLALLIIVPYTGVS